MANKGYNEAKEELLKGTLHLDGTDDIRVLLVMSNTTADTENDGIATIGNFTTLDEADGTNYTAGGIALLSETVTKDDANDRGEFDAADITWSSLGAGTRDYAGLIVYKFITNTSSSLPICWIDDGFPFAGNGSDVTVQWNAEGILQAS